MINLTRADDFSSGVWDSLCGPFLWSSGWIMTFAVIFLQLFCVIWTQSFLVISSVHLDEVLPRFVFTVIIINTVVLKTHNCWAVKITDALIYNVTFFHHFFFWPSEWNVLSGCSEYKQFCEMMIQDVWGIMWMSVSDLLIKVNTN